MNNTLRTALAALLLGGIASLSAQQATNAPGTPDQGGGCPNGGCPNGGCHGGKQHKHHHDGQEGGSSTNAPSAN